MHTVCSFLILFRQDTLDAFRSEIMKKSSMSVFEAKKSSSLTQIRKMKGQETFPQPFQKEKLEHRRKGIRYNTVPVTSGELMKIPEFIMNGSSKDINPGKFIFDTIMY